MRTLQDFIRMPETKGKRIERELDKAFEENKRAFDEFFRKHGKNKDKSGNSGHLEEISIEKPVNKKEILGEITERMTIAIEKCEILQIDKSAMEDLYTVKNDLMSLMVWL